MIISNQNRTSATLTQDALARSLNQFGGTKNDNATADSATISEAGTRQAQLAQIASQNQQSALTDVGAQNATAWVKANLFSSQALQAQANLSAQSVLKVLDEQ